LVNLLDDAIPIVAGSEVNDHPYAPLSKEARDKVAAQGDATPLEWVGREARYHEKLATPDVTIADLIGEIDMIKHAEGRYLSDELTMHFGLIPRTNRGIFCINELPDLTPKIQVGLFNVLEERDVAIPVYIKEIVEEIARLARSSTHVNQQSGVSVRMSIANLENVVSNAERRALINGERWIVPRIADLVHVAPSARGKLELTMAEDD